MPADAIDLDAYTERIGYSGGREPSLETLQALHALHPAAIPFENLSPLLGLGVDLDAVALQDKLVTRKRGGYCFEHNLLFLHVLKTLGFQVKGLAARVLWNLPEQVVLPRTHMLLVVDIDNVNYIADVGFGGLTMTAPLRLNPAMEQTSPHELFRLTYADRGYTLQVKLNESWNAMYTFDLQQQHQADYELMNWYVSSHPRSRFVNELIAARPDKTHRHALLNHEYTAHYLDGKTEKRTLGNVTDMREILETAFHIPLDDLPGVKEKLESLLIAVQYAKNR